MRILSRRTAERALLKGFVGNVVDVAFAHREDAIVAAIDEMGNLFVYGLEMTQDRKIVYPLELGAAGFWGEGKGYISFF